MVKTTAVRKVESGAFKWETPEGPTIIWDFENSPAAGSDPMSDRGSIARYQKLTEHGDITESGPVPCADIKWCAVSLSEAVSRGHRLEAGVFDVEAKQALEDVRNCKYPTVNLISDDGPVQKAHYGNRAKRNYVPKESSDAIGFIGSSEMLDVYPHPIKFMKDDYRTAEIHVSENTLLLSRSGTIGNVAFVNKTLSKLLVSEHAIRLECESTPGYVYTFLRTKTGKRLIESNIYGAVIQQIEPEHLAEIPIPDAPAPLKAEIHDRIVRSYELRDESNDLIDEATALLIEELQLPPLHQLTGISDETPQVEAFRIKLSNLDGRADASYHIPVTGAIVQHLHKHAAEVTTVGDPRISRDVILPGRFKRVYVEEEHGVRFLGGKEINQLDPCTEKHLSRREHKKQLETILGIKENAILTPARGSLGSVTLPCRHFLNWAISDNMMQILSRPKIYGYLYIFLNSAYGNLLIKKFTYGGVVDAIEPSHIKQVPVPLLKSQDTQARINDLALQANDKRYEAYLLEQEAIDMMNQQVIFAK